MAEKGLDGTGMMPVRSSASRNPWQPILIAPKQHQTAGMGVVTRVVMGMASAATARGMLTGRASWRACISAVPAKPDRPEGSDCYGLCLTPFRPTVPYLRDSQ